MLKIRLQRIGRRNDPSFRVVVTDSHESTKTGNFLEVLGSHSPTHHVTNLKKDRILHWISKGAQTSGTIHNMLISQGVTQGKKINVLPRRTVIKKEEAVVAAAVPAAAAPEATLVAAAEVAEEPTAPASAEAVEDKSPAA